MEKPLEITLVGTQVKCGGVSGNYQCEATVLARLMESLIRCPPASFEAVGLSKGTMASASTFLWEKDAPPALILKPDIKFLPVCPWCLLSYCPSAGA